MRAAGVYYPKVDYIYDHGNKNERRCNEKKKQREGIFIILYIY